MKALLILNLIVPIVMIVVSFVLKKRPVSDIHSRRGYNTTTSRKSNAHWDYAQKIAPDVFMYFGKIFLAFEILLCLAFYFLTINAGTAVIVGSIIGLCGLLLAFLKTEKAIKNKYPD